MQILSADFLTSAAESSGWPQGDRKEVAFCGRSNVGKSTLLNALLRRKGMARVSRTPGRTRLINFFALKANPSEAAKRGLPVPQELLLADLPGFGYAKVSKAERSTWRPLIQDYLTRRQSLQAVVLLLDSRRVVDLKEDPELLREEEDLASWLRSLGKAVVPVMTKVDKLAKHERKPAAERVHRLLGVAPVIFSALEGEGASELWRRLERSLWPQNREVGEEMKGGAP